jgi:hypothetical protein
MVKLETGKAWILIIPTIVESSDRDGRKRGGSKKNHATVTRYRIGPGPLFLSRRASLELRPIHAKDRIRHEPSVWAVGSTALLGFADVAGKAPCRSNASLAPDISDSYQMGRATRPSHQANA